LGSVTVASGLGQVIAAKSVESIPQILKGCDIMVSVQGD